MSRVYSFRTAIGPVDLAFTDRFGGVSAAPFDELNLGINTADLPHRVAENLHRVLHDFAPEATPARAMTQVHGDRVAVLADALDDPGEADGLVTDAADLVLVVRVADCVPVLLADPVVGVVGVAHAGRRGVQVGLVSRVVDQMRALAAERITAWIGPHICAGCYEVPPSMQDEVAAIEPETRALTSWGTASIDLAAGVRAQLGRSGVEVIDASRCTRESADLYSHRRDGAEAGRLAGLVRIRSAA
ncbi:peptidoglycan editing factor PgeF [Nocardioides limicola]|uniref:peptidoglycan editing factor PgeF n=1 Tax=Nocardioides limicola TaxID=2803368 RepID=UPI0027DD671A|nr:peptidoglycan editing factor PgeF [Nocardioides sp. DJM-14]